MKTNGTGAVNPLSPRKEQINVEDIAESLSKQCRFNGHCRGFYSVAEHSVNVLELGKWMTSYEGLSLSSKDKLQFLLHDATEAYVGDLIRPIKDLVPVFKLIEDGFWEVIAEAFEINTTWHPILDQADKVCYALEALELRPWETLKSVEKDIPYQVHPDLLSGNIVPIRGITIDNAKDFFMFNFNKIIEEIKNE